MVMLAGFGQHPSCPEFSCTGNTRKGSWTLEQICRLYNHYLEITPPQLDRNFFTFCNNLQNSCELSQRDLERSSTSEVLSYNRVKLQALVHSSKSLYWDLLFLWSLGASKLTPFSKNILSQILINYRISGAMFQKFLLLDKRLSTIYESFAMSNKGMQHSVR